MEREERGSVYGSLSGAVRPMDTKKINSNGLLLTKDEKNNTVLVLQRAKHDQKFLDFFNGSHCAIGGESSFFVFSEPVKEVRFLVNNYEEP